MLVLYFEMFFNIARDAKQKGRKNFGIPNKKNYP